MKKLPPPCNKEPYIETNKIFIQNILIFRQSACRVAIMVKISFLRPLGGQERPSPAQADDDDDNHDNVMLCRVMPDRLAHLKPRFRSPGCTPLCSVLVFSAHKLPA